MLVRYSLISSPPLSYTEMPTLVQRYRLKYLSFVCVCCVTLRLAPDTNMNFENMLVNRSRPKLDILEFYTLCLCLSLMFVSLSLSACLSVSLLCDQSLSVCSSSSPPPPPHPTPYFAFKSVSFTVNELLTLAPSLSLSVFSFRLPSRASQRTVSKATWPLTT